MARLSLLLVLLSLLIGFRFSFWSVFPLLVIPYLFLVSNFFVLAYFCRTESNGTKKLTGSWAILIVPLKMLFLLACSFIASTIGGTLWFYFFGSTARHGTLAAYSWTLNQPEILFGSVLGYAVGLLDLIAFLVYLSPNPGIRLQQLYAWVTRSPRTTAFVVCMFVFAGISLGFFFSMF